MITEDFLLIVYDVLTHNKENEKKKGGDALKCNQWPFACFQCDRSCTSAAPLDLGDLGAVAIFRTAWPDEWRNEKRQMSTHHLRARFESSAAALLRDSSNHNRYPSSYLSSLPRRTPPSTESTTELSPPPTDSRKRYVGNYSVFYCHQHHVDVRWNYIHPTTSALVPNRTVPR